MIKGFNTFLLLIIFTEVISRLNNLYTVTLKLTHSFSLKKKTHQTRTLTYSPVDVKYKIIYYTYDLQAGVKTVIVTLIKGGAMTISSWKNGDDTIAFLII